MAPWTTSKPAPGTVPVIHVVPDSPTGTIHSVQSDAASQPEADITPPAVVPPTLLLDAASPIIRHCPPADLPSLFQSFKSLAIPISGLDATSSHIGPSQCDKETETLLQHVSPDCGLQVGTKVCTRGNHLGSGNGELHAHQIRQSLQNSLQRARCEKMSWLIAQRPDASVAVGELTGGFDGLLQEGLCESWGVKDFHTRQLRDLLMTCRRRQLAAPSIYQCRYNVLARNDLECRIPLIRDHGMQIHAYDPLAAGLLSGQTHSSTAWQSHHYDAGQIQEAKNHAKDAAQYDLTIQDAALRWLSYHSCLGKDDAIILNASSMQDLQAKVSAISQGPLQSSYLLDRLEKVI